MTNVTITAEELERPRTSSAGGIESATRISTVSALPPVQSLWIGPSLGPIERMTIRSFLANGHPFHLYCYDEIKNVPEGTELLDASCIVPRHKIFANTANEFGKGSYSPFSNIFRSMVLFEKGGWWVDMDVVCIRPLTLRQLNVISTSNEWQYGQLANVNVLRFEQRHPLLEMYVDLIQRRYEEEVAHGIGPTTMQILLRENPQFREYLVPPEYFNPIGWRSAKYLVQRQEPLWSKRRLSRLLGRSPAVGSITSKTLGLHLWNEVWRREKLDPAAHHWSGSIFEHLRRKYGD